MAVKTIFVVCAQLLLLKAVQSSQPSNLTPLSLSSACRGPLILTSVSPISPTGLNLAANDLTIDGNLNVNGTLPFLGTVALDGPVPIEGQSSVIYGCGNSNVGIFQEGLPCGAKINPGYY